MAKNANGEGSIYKRMRDGKLVRYEGAVTYIGDDGTTKRHTVYGRTRQDVRDKLRNARERLAIGAPVRDATRTVADWLAQWRATTLAVSDRKPTTREMYAHLCRKHLEPAPFGAITLDRLRPTDIEALILRCNDRGLSDSSVRSVYTVLRLALDGAVRDQLLARNPAAVVKRLGVARREAVHASAVDVTALLNAAEGLRYRDVPGADRGDRDAPRRGASVALDRPRPRRRSVDRAGHPRAHRRQAGGVRAQDGPVAANRAARRIFGGDAAGPPQAAGRRATPRSQPVAELGSGVYHRARDTGRAAQHPSHRRDGRR
jgi:hypothetical protein